MRYFIFITLALLVAIHAYADTPTQEIARLQASIDSIRTVISSDGCNRAAIWARQQVNQDTAGANTLTNFGISILKDTPDASNTTSDSMYVRIDFPLQTSTGVKKQLVKFMMSKTVDAFGGMETSTLGRLKIRKDRAVAALRKAIELLAL